MYPLGQEPNESWHPHFRQALAFISQHLDRGGQGPLQLRSPHERSDMRGQCSRMSLTLMRATKLRAPDG